MVDIYQIADKADIIVNGYAFTKCDMGFRVLNLNNPEKAAVLSFEGEMLETTMDGIELSIVEKYFTTNREVMED